MECLTETLDERLRTFFADVNLEMTISSLMRQIHIH
jgi:hypothetical protein